MSGRWGAVVVVLLVVAVIGALVWLAVFDQQQSAQLGCQRSYISRLTVVLAGRAQAADAESAGQLAETKVLLAEPGNAAAVIAARQAYAALLDQVHEYQDAHPLPVLPACV